MSKVDRHTIEQLENWRKHQDDMPYISLPSGYSITVIPPFAGAMLRFSIKYGKQTYSVYYDVNGSLGYMGVPYYEVYPIAGDTYRSTNIADILREIFIDAEGEASAKLKYPELFIWR